MLKTQLGEDIIKMYKPYQNKNTQWIKTIMSNQPVQVYARYQVKQLIGKGAYGIVVAAKDKQAKTPQKRLVAIKKISKAFQHKIFTRRTLRELKLLKMLNHQNIIGIQTIMLPKSRQDFDDLYVVFELMQTDLHTIIKNKNEPLPQQKYKFLLYQILRGLKYIHSAKIVHRDLKPRNLLINANADLKICDFGLGRYIQHKPKSYILTDYVTTRWYRAPQLLLGCNTYETSVDIWSVGCILAEMILRKPFLPGSGTRQQIELICQVIGVPADLQQIKHIPPKNLDMVKLISKKKKKVRDFDAIFGNAPKQVVDLIKKMLIFNPDKRITVQEALKHPFLQDLHLQQDEPVCGKIDVAQFEFQDHNLTTQQLKDLLYEQILLYNNEEFKNQFEKKKKEGKSLITHILQSSNAHNINPITDESDEQEDDDLQ